MALLVTSLAIVFSLRSIDQAKRVGDLAWEMRRAQTTLGYLLENTPATFEPATGQVEGFSWRVETDATGAERPIEICLRSAVLTSAESGRSYRAASLQACPRPPAS